MLSITGSWPELRILTPQVAYDEYTAPEQPGRSPDSSGGSVCAQMLQSVLPVKIAARAGANYRQWSGNKVSEGPFPLARFICPTTTGPALTPASRNDLRIFQLRLEQGRGCVQPGRALALVIGTALLGLRRGGSGRRIQRHGERWMCWFTEKGPRGKETHHEP